MLIKVIERFCELYDVIINVKKTKWLRFGPKYSDEVENVTLLGQPVEQVAEFKFLGVTICDDLDFKPHIKKRTSMYRQAVSEINNLGFDDTKIPVKIKTLLYQSLARPKLMYGLESMQIKRNDVQDMLSKLEGNVLKRSNSLGSNSKTTPLAYAMEITPIALQIMKRKIGFVIQLVHNQATRSLITAGYHISLNDVTDYITIDDERKALVPMRYEGILLSACISKLESIKQKEKILKETPLVVATRYLLNNRNQENDATVKHIYCFIFIVY
jgi:hypothetical protein